VRSVLPLHVVVQVVLGAFVYFAVYWTCRALKNRLQI
jgi:hypothetical protein